MDTDRILEEMLATALAVQRRDPGGRGILVMAALEGAVYALRRMDQISQDDFDTWMRRIANELDLSPSAARMDRQAYFGLWPAPASPEEAQAARNLRVEGLLRGLLLVAREIDERVLVPFAALYTDGLIVRWQMKAPNAKSASSFVPPAQRSVPFSPPARISVSDDAGTRYFEVGGAIWGTPPWVSGESHFAPAIPSGTSRLTLAADGAELVLDLTDSSRALWCDS